MNVAVDRGRSLPFMAGAWSLALAAAAALAVSAGWVGFIASDDAFYYYAALQWLTHPPAAADTHWAARLPIVLSLAVAIKLFGRGLIAMHVTSILWYLAVVATSAGLATQIAGRRAGWIAALIVATMPVIATNASIVDCDLPEAAFMLGGVWLLLAGQHSRSALLSGGCFGLAILSRETAILSLLGLIFPLVIGLWLPRQRLLVVGAGILCVLGAEMAFQYWLTGNAFHRYALAIHHDHHIDRAANLEGNVLIHPVIDPLLVLLINNEFGMIFWVGGAIFLSRSQWADISPQEHRGFFVIFPMAASGFLLIASLYYSLVLNPRYFSFAAIAMALAVARWLSRQSRPLASSVLALLLVSNLVLLSLSNAHPHWPGEALAIAARTHPHDLIASPAEIVHRADLLLQADASHNVHMEPFGAAKLRLGPRNGQSDEVIVASYPPPPRRLGSFADALGLLPLLPAAVQTWLMSTGPSVILTQQHSHGRRGGMG